MTGSSKRKIKHKNAYFKRVDMRNMQKLCEKSEQECTLKEKAAAMCRLVISYCAILGCNKPTVFCQCHFCLSDVYIKFMYNCVLQVVVQVLRLLILNVWIWNM